jgi:hypothetical protein
MEPLRPMKPMKPMTPMTPLTPMAGPERWWPDDLQDPSSSGAQNGARYAFFQDEKLLLIEHDGRLQRFRTGEHRVTGFSQASGAGSLAFRSERGPLSLEEFEEVT